MPSHLSQLQALPPFFRQSLLRSIISTSLRPSPSIPFTFEALRHSSTTTTAAEQPIPSRPIRPLVPPPKTGSGPLLERRADRSLPPIPRPIITIWLRTLPIFILVITLSALAIFNYEKSSSSTVNSILYALRINPVARDLLGDEIYFASAVPWISGELAPMQGIINISFWVKGTKGQGKVKFVSVKRGRERGTYFETVEWSLQFEDGRMIQLLEKEGGKESLRGANFE
jgi:cytochrome c oxidase assembly factor 1